jgi:hypothetical protein
MSDREMVLDMVRKLPEQATLAEIQEELAFVAKLRRRLGKVERGEVNGVPPEDVAKRLRSWTTK